MAFSRAQARAIQDELDSRRVDNERLDSFLSRDGDSEPVFVKSLELVQGDERDRIVFSVGYGPDETGTMSMNFGPLNDAGGHRRLNVAITRARRQVVVVTSIEPEDIDPTRTSNRGIADFKQYLAYVRSASDAESATRDDHPTPTIDAEAFETQLAADVYEQLTEAGYILDPDPGGAGYTLDMAVRAPDMPDRYALGIECDASAAVKTETTRERDRLRQQVLEAREWTVYRVWAPAWTVNPDRELSRIAEAINEQCAPDGNSSHQGFTSTDDLPVTLESNGDTPCPTSEKRTRDSDDS